MNSATLENSLAAADAHAEAAAYAFPAPGQMRSRDVFRLAPRIWPFIRPYRRHLLYLMLLMTPSLPGGVFAIYISKIFFDVIGSGQPLSAGEALILFLPMSASPEQILWRACLILGIGLLLALPYAMALFSYAVWILQRVTNQFRVDLYTRMQELSLRFHSEEKIGDAIFRMFQDSAAIPAVIDGLVIQPLRTVPLLIANVVELILFNYRMAIVGLAVLPIDLAIALWFAAPLRRRFLEERETAARATTRIEETLAAIRTVKAFGREEEEAATYARENWAAFMAARRARIQLVTYRVLIHTVRGIATVAAIYLGAREVLGGGYAGAVHATVSLGLFQGAFGITSKMTERANFLTNLWAGLQDVGIAIARVIEMMGKVPEERVRSGTLRPPAYPKSISFEQVSFSYDGDGSVLSEVDFQAPAGEITAIEGPSGAGKSTLISLMLRFFDPDSGCVALDGRDVREFQLGGYRSAISVALQESPLFTATLRDNIIYGYPEATNEELMRAIARAGLSSFVSTLPSGLETMLGEKGAKLSTGQAQRIGIARAFLREAPILILDEPTSALDSATEETVMRGLRDWIDEGHGGRVVIIATHRASTAALADRVFRISDGRISEVQESAAQAAMPVKG